MADEAKRIYIADDDDNIRQVVRTFLANDGYETEDFPTGDLLLERFLQKPCRRFGSSPRCDFQSRL